MKLKMAILTDDQDLREVYMHTDAGGNGDYYLTLAEYPNKECKSSTKEFKSINYRLSISGGNTNKMPEVRDAFVALHRAMEKYGLNNYPEPMS